MKEAGEILNAGENACTLERCEVGWRKWFHWGAAISVLLLVGLSAALPTGDVFHVNPKYVLFGSALTFLVIHFLITPGSIRPQTNGLWMGGIILAWLTAGTVSAWVHQGSMISIRQQVPMVAAPVLVCWLGYLAVRTGIVTARSVILTAVATHLLYAGGKVTLSCLTAAKIIPVASGYQILAWAWPDANLPLGVYPGGFIHILMRPDIIIIVMVLVLLSWDRWRLTPRLPILLLLVLASIEMACAALNFTRMAWILAGTGLFTGCVLVRDRWRWGTLAGVILFFVVTMICSAEWSRQVAQRWLHSESGDAVRVEQMRRMWEAFLIAPWFGHGWGYAVPNYQSNAAQPFLYEVQWVSWLMQTGIVGMALLGLLVGGVVRTLLRAGWRSVPVLMVFAVLMAAGFTNALLTCSTTGVGVLVLMLLAGIAREPSTDVTPTQPLGQ